jgi:hypothetical protein
MVDRLDHARIHWGYKCDDLEPLFEYITPAQWIIDLIPRGDNRDVGAAVITAKGELDEIDMSGENNPMYGKKHTEEQKEHKRQVSLKQWQIPIEDGGRKGWKPTEEMNRHNSETKKQLYADGILVPSMKGKTQSEETKKKKSPMYRLLFSHTPHITTENPRQRPLSYTWYSCVYFKVILSGPLL